MKSGTTETVDFRKVIKLNTRYFTDDELYEETYHGLRKKTYEITYVLNYEKLEPGYVVFGEKEVNNK